MFKQRAIFFALDAIIQPIADESGYRWTFDPRLPGVLRDYKAMGFHLIGVLDPMTFGLLLDSDEERAELAAFINECLVDEGAPGLEAIHIADELSDPRPIWTLRRRFNLSLGASVVIGTGEAWMELRSNAGIGNYEWAADVLGSLYPTAADPLGESALAS